MSNLSTHIINFATGYENAFNNRVMSIASQDNTISIRFRINANKAYYQSDIINVFANTTYNVNTGKMTITTENGKGSRTYNSYVKYECEQLINVFVDEAKKALDVEIREENRNAYDTCHIELLSMIDQTNSTHKNLCYGYINQILDMYQNNASASEMLSKLVDVKKEMLSDTRIFPITETFKSSTENDTYITFDRSFSTYDEAYNYCIQSDFDTDFILHEKVNMSHNRLTLDLQHFSSHIPTNRTIHESNYDTIKIITTKGEYIARIHPSDIHSDMHKICFSSDDYIYISDSDILSVSPMYRKVIIDDNGIVKRGIGKGLSLTYTIETTKADIDVDTINYSNIHKYTYNSLQKVLERFNCMQQMGYHNINIITEVTHRNDSILIDATECNIELDINTQYMTDLKKENREQREYVKQLEEELSRYKEFMSHYKAEKTFDEFKKKVNEREAS